MKILVFKDFPGQTLIFQVFQTWVLIFLFQGLSKFSTYNILTSTSETFGAVLCSSVVSSSSSSSSSVTESSRLSSCILPDSVITNLRYLLPRTNTHTSCLQHWQTQNVYLTKLKLKYSKVTSWLFQSLKSMTATAIAVDAPGHCRNVPRIVYNLWPQMACPFSVWCCHA